MQLLLDRLDILVDRIEKHFLHQYHLTDTSDSYYEFHEQLLTYLPTAIKKFQLPEQTDQRYDVVADFISKFINSIWYRGTCSDAYKKYRKRRDKEVPFITSEESAAGYKGIPYDHLQVKGESMEDQTIRLDMEERTYKSYNLFNTMLSEHEKRVFAAMKSGMKIPKMREAIIAAGGKDYTEDQLRYQRKYLEFRLLCFFGMESVKLYDKDVVIKAINKYPEICKRFFGMPKIESIPSDEELRYIAAGKFLRENNEYKASLEEKVKEYDPKAKKISKQKYEYVSKIDFNGKKHDHPVVYINKDGYAYDQVTKQSKELR